jgi:rubredoxin
MKVVDPGHVYDIESLNGGPSQRIHFVKREGSNYPGNIGTQDGPITQEFLRAILHRCEYMNNQGSCAETDIIIAALRTAIFAFEVRASRCRGTSIELPHLSDIDATPTCPICGHIQCDPERHLKPHWSELKPAFSKATSVTLASANIAATESIPMLLRCPECSVRHIDEGEFATKPHHTHACQECGAVWRPAIVPTVGVRFLPGFKNE